MANANKPAMASSTPAAMTSTPGANAKTSDSGGKIGVPECDEFITAYEACISKNVPEAARAQYKTILAQWRDSWPNKTLLQVLQRSDSLLIGVVQRAVKSAGDLGWLEPNYWVICRIGEVKLPAPRLEVEISKK